MATSNNLKLDTSSLLKPEPPSAAVVSRLSSPATPAKNKSLAAAAAAAAASPASSASVISSIAQKLKASPATTQGISVGNKANEKQVRFGSRSGDSAVAGAGTTATAVSQQAQHRYVSPARSVATGKNPGAEPSPSILEYQTYRSPDRTSPETKRGGVAGEETEVPSLCSAYSGAMVSTSSVASTVGSESAVTSKYKSAPAASISVDHSDASAASPLGQASHADDSSYRQETASAGRKGRSNGGDISSLTSRVSGQEGTQSLDSLAKASAEMAAKSNAERRYLPPSPPKSSFLRDIADEKKGGDEDLPQESEMEHHSKMADFAPQSPRSRDHVSTPTDFAVDYCKSSNTTFDSSNVLAWLQSPTAHGLFSPGGGLGSLMNTPAGGAPRSPRTPTISTSFFFADVASLPKTDTTPNRSDGSKKAKGSTICISPLASTRPRPSGMLSAGTPLDFKDIFASPKERKTLPLLGGTPKADRAKSRKGGKIDPSIDAVHLAERDLLEDEDLNVLLQLASNTPASKHGGGDSSGAVFRSPAPKEGEGENFPGLELPMIGNDADGDNKKEGVKAKLQQKPEGRSSMGDEAFGPPQLGMRSSSSVGSVTANTKSDAAKEAEKITGPAKDSDLEAVASGASALRTAGSNSLANANPYPVAPYPVPADMQAYYPMAGVPPVPPNSSGSMRVVMGGPPPRRNNNNSNGKPGVSPARPGSSPPFHEYPPPPGSMPYPPPPGMFSSFAYGGMGRYPPYSHYPPPPRQMPVYNSQHPTGGNTTLTATSTTTTKTTIKTTIKEPKKTKAAKAGANSKLTAGSKRSAPPAPTLSSDLKAAPLAPTSGATTAAASPTKRQKKSPGPKKKNRTPPLYGAERDKSATAVHAVNKASGSQNDKAAALAAAILRGVTMRPSGKWQAQLYFAGKSRYIGVFDSREKAALAYEIAREKLKTGSSEGGLSTKQTENLVNAARKAAFDGVNERLPK